VKSQPTQTNLLCCCKLYLHALAGNIGLKAEDETQEKQQSPLFVVFVCSFQHGISIEHGHSMPGSASERT